MKKQAGFLLAILIAAVGRADVITSGGPTEAAAVANALGDVSFKITGGQSRTAVVIRNGELVYDRTELTSASVVLPKSMRILSGPTLHPGGVHGAPYYTVTIDVSIDPTQRLDQVSALPPQDPAEIRGLGALVAARKDRQDRVQRMFDAVIDATPYVIDPSVTIDSSTLHADGQDVWADYTVPISIDMEAYRALVADVKAAVDIGRLAPETDAGVISARSQPCVDQSAARSRFSSGGLPFEFGTPLQRLTCTRITNWTRAAASRFPSSTLVVFAAADQPSGQAAPVRWHWFRLPWQLTVDRTPVVIVEFLGRDRRVLAIERFPLGGYLVQPHANNGALNGMNTVVFAPGKIRYDVSEAERSLWDLEYAGQVSIRRRVKLSAAVARDWDCMQVRIVLAGPRPGIAGLRTTEVSLP